MICSVEGCDRPVKPRGAFGMCRIHRERVIRGEPAGAPVKPNLAGLTIEERIAAQSRTVESGCIEWLGNRDGFGYGFIQIGLFTRRAHRVYYEIVRGLIPDGLELDHLCRNHSCINPDHLEAVTHRENSLRGTSPMAEYARRTECLNGHPLTPENTYASTPGWRRCKTCHHERDARYRAQRTRVTP